MRSLTILLCAVSGLASAQTVLTLQPGPLEGKDALLHGLSGYTTINFAENGQLPANAWTFQGTPGTVRSILQFDLECIPIGAIVNTAYLNLYAWDKTTSMGQHSASSASNAAWLERVTSPWTESLVVWDNQPSTTTVNRVALPPSTSPTDDYLSIDVTAMLQDMVNDPDSSYGFMLMLQTESHYRRLNFCSSDHPDPARRPLLEISYSHPSASDTCICIRPGRAGKDAFVHGLPSQVGINYGQNHQLTVNAWTFQAVPGAVRSLIEFDLGQVPANVTIDTALLSFFAWDSLTSMGQHDPQSGPNACWVERVTGFWNEQTVTWLNQPPTTAQNRLVIPSSSHPSQDFVAIGVTRLVQDMLNDPSNSFGFMIKLQDENYYRRMNFASSDHPNHALHPQLRVCYSVESPPPPPSSVGALELRALVYPNPTTGSFWVNVSESALTTVEIQNSLGQVVRLLDVNQSPAVIDLINQPRGVYLVTIRNEGGTAQQRVVLH